MLSARSARPASQRSPSARRGPGAAPWCWRYGRGPQRVAAHREGPPRSCGRFPAYLAKDAARRQTGVNAEAARPGAARAWSLAPSRGVFQAGSVGVGRTASFSASFSALGESTRAAPPSWSCGTSSALAAWRRRLARCTTPVRLRERAPRVPEAPPVCGGPGCLPFFFLFPFSLFLGCLCLSPGPWWAPLLPDPTLASLQSVLCPEATQGVAHMPRSRPGFLGR